MAEALEISTFMEKMGTKGENEDLSELAMDDWAKYDNFLMMKEQ